MSTLSYISFDSIPKSLRKRIYLLFTNLCLPHVSKPKSRGRTKISSVSATPPTEASERSIEVTGLKASKF